MQLTGVFLCRHDNLNLKVPLFFCRHVYKYVLGTRVVRAASPSRLLLLLQPCSRARAGRKITFADFAFFDSEQYKILFELVRSAVRNRLRSTWCVVA